MVRLLWCHVCKSVDQIPDYDGPPEYDYYLEYRVQQHQFADGRPHRGILGRAKNTPSEISAAMDQMSEAVAPGGGSGLGEPLYDLRDNYKVEAMQCWKRHNRTSDCGDYRSEAKRLYADTKADRKSEGLSVNRNERPNAFLCDFCPVESIVQTARNKAKGLYK